MSGNISDQTTNLSNLTLSGNLIVDGTSLVRGAQTFSGAIVGASTLSMVGTSSLGPTNIVGTSTITLGSLTVSNSGYTGTPLQAFSATSFLGVLMTVQGSASSFSIFQWKSARSGDAIQIVPFGSGGVSSLSSGIVLHSHSTQDGQVEVRWSNCSTLAQLQSAITYYIYRWSAF